ncbi:MAG: helix-turn-helix domain-containing protein [Candidatus Thermoplasmatota archaeon]|nr:helix-turn-helix domain-containing protein [Candidatus Thermoplasmatota archaeon]
MLLVNLTIASQCGLTLAADSSESSIITTSVNHRSNGKNMVFAFSDDRNKDSIRHDLSKDFLDIHISKMKRAIFIYGEKKGHGMISAISEGSGLLLMPVIAKNGTENFRYVVRDLEGIETVEKNVFKSGNKIETMNYDRINDENILLSSFSILHYYPLANVTPVEWKILRIAYSAGYYSWPRTAQLSKISDSVGASKTSVLYHLRNGERKILQKFLGN